MVFVFLYLWDSLLDLHYLTKVIRDILKVLASNESQKGPNGKLILSQLFNWLLKPDGSSLIICEFMANRQVIL